MRWWAIFWNTGSTNWWQLFILGFWSRNHWICHYHFTGWWLELFKSCGSQNQLLPRDMFVLIWKDMRSSRRRSRMARSNMGCHRYTCRRKINTFWNNNKKWFPFVRLQTQHVPMKKLCHIRGIQHFGCNCLDRIVGLHPFSSATVWQQCVFPRQPKGFEPQIVW